MERIEQVYFQIIFLAVGLRKQTFDLARSECVINTFLTKTNIYYAYLYVTRQNHVILHKINVSSAFN